MKQRRDTFQRKCIAIRRLTLALARLDRSKSVSDKEKAGRWVSAWRTVAEIRQFKLDRPGRRCVPRAWHLDLPPCI
jgi:hypothetical protein